MSRYTASQIAKWFLAYNNIHVAEESADYISNMKLQKLLYYAQGVYMGITGKKLFVDPTDSRENPIAVTTLAATTGVINLVQYFASSPRTRTE